MQNLLSQDCRNFLNELDEKFGERHTSLLENRLRTQEKINNGFIPKIKQNSSKFVRKSFPENLLNRTIEITGPAERKLMINAFNSGVNGYMCDLEDSLAPNWDNVTKAHNNLYDYVHKKLEYTCPIKHKEYAVKNYYKTTFHVRPRGWHLFEKHYILPSGKYISASLFDFGVYFFNCAKELLNNNTGVYLYLPKMECAEEGKLWNDIFNFAEETLQVPTGSICATVLIEHILLAFEMDDLIVNMKDYIVGLNCGRWDYIFSFIKKFKGNTLPNRSQVTMSTHFMESYVKLLVNTCHKRGVFAMGGMSALVPSKDAETNIINFEKVYKDKQGEASKGLDGTWIAHPGLLQTAEDAFKTHRLSHSSLNQLDIITEDEIQSADLLEVPKGNVDTIGINENLTAMFMYIHAWLNGSGAISLNNMMEDAATAEISRAQLWTWISNKVVDEMTDEVITVAYISEVFNKICDEYSDTEYTRAKKFVYKFINEGQLSEFLTNELYEYV